MLGFTFATTLTGFIYGFPSGIMPAVCGAFIGAMVAFALIRKYNFARFIKFSASKQEKYVAIQEAIEQGGFKVRIVRVWCVYACVYRGNEALISIFASLR